MYNVNPAIVNSMMLRSSMLAFEKVYCNYVWSKLHEILSFLTKTGFLKKTFLTKC